MARFALALLPLTFALLPIAASAQTTTSVPLPQTNVMRAPVTFSASASGPQMGQNGAPTGDRSIIAERAIREQRYAQERAFVQRYGRGVPVKLRARRY